MHKGSYCKYFLLLFWLVSLSSVHAQDSNLRCKWVSTKNKTIKLDTLLIDESSITISNLQPNYNLNFNKSEITFQDPQLPDSLYICYRTYPAELSESSQLRSYDEYDSLAPFTRKRPIQVALSEREELFVTDEIYKSGSLTRGISFGNSRSLGVTSSLNFQMEGKLTENLNVRANITDQNVPFQPEGNTQQLREFDNVSIEVFNEKLSLRAGDVVLKNPENYFLKYYKNVQGGQFKTNYNLSEQVKGESTLTIATAKGQFADVTIPVEEGVQGPYKLRGPNGERFVIVIANSESIYLDGRLLERGFNNDYVIDYNLGEITFNPTVLITRFTRIRATYEYSDRNYSRTITNATQSMQIGNLSLDLNYYQEKDSRNNPLSFELSDQDKLLMSLAGEENIPVPIQGDRPTLFNQNIVMYEKRDTLDLDGNAASVFVFTADSIPELFQVVFTEVGQGNGDYVLLSNNVNGRVFNWVSPENGISTGNFAPVQFVPAPNKRQMATVGLNYQIRPTMNIYSQFAFSDHDLNLFSDIDSDDDHGMAVKTGFVIDKQPVSFLNGYELSSNVDFEFDSKNFNPIDRFRYIEFDRDWSFNPEAEVERSSDNIFNINTALIKNRNNLFKYRFSSRVRGQSINGSQHNIELNQTLGVLALRSGAWLMNNDQAAINSNWEKAHAEISLNKFSLIPGYRFEMDQNVVKNIALDSAISTAMNFKSHQMFLKSSDSSKVRFALEHVRRIDRSVLDGAIRDFSSTRTTRLLLKTDIGKSNRLDINFTYRNLTFLEAFEGNPDEETVLGKINWSGSFFKNNLRTDLSYATSSSREIRREFIFIPVVSGEGTHTWRDLNEDGVQDITEFFEAINPDERNYVKIFVPTDEFVSAFNNILNWNIHASMPKSWRSESGIKGLLSKFSNKTNININKKNTDDSFGSRFNPFSLSTSNQDLIFLKSALRNTLFFNRANPGFGFDLTYFSSNSKQLISNGIDSRSRNDWTLNMRKKLSGFFILQWKMQRGLKENASDFLEDRNFEIDNYAIFPQLVWQPSPNLRITNEIGYQKKNNNQSSDLEEFSRTRSFSTFLRWSNAKQNTLDASFRYREIEFEGDENSPAGYELLDALRPGRNLSWNLNFRQKLANGIQILLSYDGRKSNGQRVIHLGRMQVSAFF